MTDIPIRFRVINFIPATPLFAPMTGTCDAILTIDGVALIVWSWRAMHVYTTRKAHDVMHSCRAPMMAQGAGHHQSSCQGKVTDAVNRELKRLDARLLPPLHKGAAPHRR